MYKAYEAANKSAVRIKITPGSKAGNNYACGNLVRIEGKTYISTNRHVVESRNISKLRHLQTRSKLRFDEFEEPILSDIVDLALIPVKTDRLNNYASELSEEIPQLGMKVAGISFRKKGIVYNHWIILENFGRYSYGSDLGGTHGFSGSGYFDHKGKMAVVHKGEGQFLHFDPSQKQKKEKNKIQRRRERILRNLRKKNNNRRKIKDSERPLNLINQIKQSNFTSNSSDFSNKATLLNNFYYAIKAISSNKKLNATEIKFQKRRIEEFVMFVARNPRTDSIYVEPLRALIKK